MYFVEKVKLKELNPNVTFPKHTMVTHCYTLETAIKLVKENATQYMLKKTLKYTDKTNEYDDEQPKKNKKAPKISFDMRSHTGNKHIIDIYKITEHFREGWISDDIKTIEQKIAYFCYTTYEACLDLGTKDAKANKNNNKNVVKRDRFGNKIDNDVIKTRNGVVKELKESDKYIKKQNCDDHYGNEQITVNELIQLEKFVF